MKFTTRALALLSTTISFLLTASSQDFFLPVPYLAYPSSTETNDGFYFSSEQITNKELEGLQKPFKITGDLANQPKSKLIYLSAQSAPTLHPLNVTAHKKDVCAPLKRVLEQSASSQKIIETITQQTPSQSQSNDAVLKRLYTKEQAAFIDCYFIVPNTSDTLASDSLVFQRSENPSLTLLPGIKKGAYPFAYIQRSDFGERSCTGMLYKVALANPLQAPTFNAWCAKLYALDQKITKLKSDNALSLRISWNEWHRDRLRQDKLIANPTYIVSGSLLLTALLVSGAAAAAKLGYDKYAQLKRAAAKTKTEEAPLEQTAHLTQEEQREEALNS
jgi:hypothetical protein